MMASFQLVTTSDQLPAVQQQLADQRAIGVDTETTSLDPFTAQVRLLQLAAPETVYILDLFQLPKAALAPITEVLEAERPVKVLHNAKFDAGMLRHHYGIELNAIFDTMLASQLVSAGDLNQRQGLSDLAGRYLGRRIEKTLRTSDWSGRLSQAMLDYAAEDAAVLLPLRHHLIEKIKELQLVNVAKLEFDCVLPTTAMELAGIYLDKACWERLVEKFEAQCYQLEAEVKQALTAAGEPVDLFGQADINLNSPQQVQEALARLGIPIHSTRELELESFAGQYPIVAKLIEYRHVQKFLSTYGRGLLDHIHPITGRIHADFRQIGTPTGRFSCSSPNVQQVPNIPEVRACFKAPPGRKLVVADYSQIELCILAEFSRDPKMVEAFLNGVDLHRSTASLMFNVPLDEVTKEQRAIAKTLNYGLLYGMGAAGLAARIEASLAEAERLMAKYFEVYRGVADWLRAAADTAVSVGHSRTHWGRLWKFHFDPYDREQVATVQRLGKNAPIQGCVVGDTLVYTSNGLIPIKDLAQGAKSATWVFDGQEWQRFKAIYSGPQRISRLTLENGMELSATPDHPILALRGKNLQWIELANLRLDDWVALSSRLNHGGQANAPEYHYEPSHWRATWKKIPLPTQLTPEFAESLGRLVGDGWYGGSIRNGTFHVVFGQGEEDAMNKFVTTLTTTFPGLQCATTQRDKGSARGPYHMIAATSVVVRGFLEACGLSKVSGRQKEVPHLIFEMSEALRAAFLRGLFGADGTTTKDGMPLLTTCSEKLARGVQWLLSSLGIRSILKRYTGHFRVKVPASCAQDFYDRIGFGSHVKNEVAFNRIHRTRQRHSRMAISELAKDIGQVIYRMKEYATLSPNQKAQVRRMQCGSASVEVCRQYAKLLGIVDPRLDFDYAKVARVEDTGAMADTYDVIVEAQEHRFVANGIIVHNTSADILKRAMRLVYDALQGRDAQIVNSIHDEIVVEADETIAEDVAELVRERMVVAAQEFIHAIPVEVDVAVGEVWMK